MKVWIDSSELQVILTGETLSALQNGNLLAMGCHSAEAMMLAIAVTLLEWCAWSWCLCVVNIAWLPPVR
jgi:hypothetical protein